MKKIYLVLGLLFLCAGGVLLYSALVVSNNKYIDLGKLTVSNKSIETYTIQDYEDFEKDYLNNQLEDVYITKFLYDGAGPYKTYDLDDFIENGNDYEVGVYDGTVINIHDVGVYEFTGELTGGMIAINTNGLKGEIHIVLNDAILDTDSKKVPAIYVYNKDITYSDCTVVIEAKDGTANTINGGKFKKVSLLASEELDNYQSKYSSEQLTNYTTYTKYYGVYTKEQIEKILFATVTADKEDLADGDPYYYYKGSGAISSDIDLTFEGKGSLTVLSKNKEGIESKGHLTFSGGVGDYTITSFDDCLNTTTDDSENSNAHNDLTINVHSLVAIVDLEADEGDAIDSNGTLKIDGGTVIAIAKPGGDAGIDSEKGTLINGGTVIATGDMLDAISNESKQTFAVFNGKFLANQLVALLDSNDKVVFAYQTDRTYSNLVYSSSSFVDGTYHLYQDGSMEGNSDHGFYTSGTYKKGTQMGYTTIGNMMGGRGQAPEGNPPERPDGESGEPPEGTPPEKPNGENGQPPEGNPPEKPNGDNGQPPEGNPPERPDGEVPIGGMPGMEQNINPVNADFTINGISNVFQGVSKLVTNEE
ncbi:MAG: carbohydrate-binding domain-containing protein [Bacilli bacterium]|nr:carbohydrate-binding domain-containing protein [Bacilli bacterium]